jgi:hypothetical protein
MNEREYDKIHNEGGEGYNPYRARREQEESEAAQEHARQPKTREEQIEALYRRIEIECGSVAREWGSEAVGALQKDLYAQINALKAEILADFLTIWTAEVTASRRATWNASSSRFVLPGGKKVDMVALRKAEEAQGWKLEDLKKAVALHR